MDIVTQLSVFLENRPGTLAKVCEELGRSKINIIAMTVSDTVDHAVVRLVVSDTRKALLLFEQRGVLVVENDVILIEGDNRPGSLVEVARKLGGVKVNIEYLYLATSPRSKKGVLVLRPSNVKKAFKVLTGA